MTFPPPVLESVDARRGRIWIVRDDLIPGGTKRRVIPLLLTRPGEYVYASPAYGYAQVALAYACRDAGYQATIFTAKRNTPHDRTREAQNAGAKIVMVPYGYLSVVQSKARLYAEYTGAQLLPFGLDTPAVHAALADVARSIPLTPDEVWTVAGSGTLSRALQHAWPAARFYAIQVGAKPNAGHARIYPAPEPFDRDAKIRPPFPSCANYDAKAWRFVADRASPGAVFWNVAA